ncbi:MAG TPA: right-handed parallel beta-helix repeat-containing protein, partial [Flavisolibacter sp.]
MNKQILLFFFLLIGFVAEAQMVLKRGMVIKKTTKIKKGTYLLNGYDSLSKGAIVIEGSNITVDFNNAVLKGSSGKAKPDEFYGVAVIIKSGKNITIKNLTAKGYKVAILARNVDGLKIENCDFSYNYRQRLNSTQEKEAISDWMSYHRNEADEWLRYGAAIYLHGCNNAVISSNKVTGGQNSLMMTECNLAVIYNNDFSFNSGIGIGFYRSSNNRVQHNRVNFNVRGYSHGVYSRGQDSAGLLVYEQSNSNLFYKNSATHSGDGFFLWAGQTTMDTGKGGCNDNQVMYNDFSYAPTNGV